LYELVTGSVPFSGASLTDVLVNVATRPAPRLRASRPDIPPELDACVARCLQRSPDKRYQNVAELAQGLAAVAGPHARPVVERIVRTVHATRSTPAAAADSTSADSGPPSSPDESQTARPLGATASRPTGPRRRAWSVVLSAAALGALTLALAAIHFGGRPSGDSAGSASPSEPRSSSAVAPPPAKVEPPAATLVGTAVAPENPSPRDSAAAEPPVAPSSGPSKEKGKTKKPEVRRGAVGAAPSGSVSAPSSPPAATKPNCEPNFVLDSDGEKHFKPECF
jgi:serine/threonine protein kinase